MVYISPPSMFQSCSLTHGKCFRVTDHEKVNKHDHCTISLKGITRMRDDDETEFVPLDRWEQEYSYFRKLVKVYWGYILGTRCGDCTSLSLLALIPVSNIFVL